MSAERLGEVEQQQIDEGATLNGLAMELATAREHVTDLEMRLQEAEGEAELWRGEAKMHEEQLAVSERAHEELLSELHGAHEQLEAERETAALLQGEAARSADATERMSAELGRSAEGSGHHDFL